MKKLLKNGAVFTNGKFEKCDVEVTNDVITNIASKIEGESFDVIYDLQNLYLLPGLIDVHTHLREPGFIYKETIKTGSFAGAKGGYTSIAAMPNLNPTPDCYENLKIELDAIEKDASINVYPYGTISKGEKGEELANFEEMKNYVLAFSDDGKGVQSEEMMEHAMKEAKKVGKAIVAHCEDNSLLNGGYIHDGEYAKQHGHKGICSESEWGPIKRDIELVKKTGCKYHVCHVSTKESVDIIRQAKKEGVDITCETAPHYLVFNDNDLKEDGAFKMNPPIRSEEDRLALIEGIKDGTIDMIATDHAPHSQEEKSKGLSGSVNGIVGLETAFAVLYTCLVRTNIISLQKLVELMSINPRERFNFKEVNGYCVWDLNACYEIDSCKFLSMGKSTPFDKKLVYGKLLKTVVGDKVVYEKENR